MLRKPDRFVVLSQLALAVLCAHGLRCHCAVAPPSPTPNDSGRRSSAGARGIRRPSSCDLRCPEPLGLRRGRGQGHGGYGALIELPASAVEMRDSKSARAMRAQMAHGKRMVQGLCHRPRARRATLRPVPPLGNPSQQSLFAGSANCDAGGAREGRASSWSCCTRHAWLGRTPSKLDGRLLWAPLCPIAQRAAFHAPAGGKRCPAVGLEASRLALEAQLGPPLHEDADAQIYALRAADRVAAARSRSKTQRGSHRRRHAPEGSPGSLWVSARHLIPSRRPRQDQRAIRRLVQLQLLDHTGRREPADLPLPYATADRERAQQASGYTSSPYRRSCALTATEPALSSAIHSSPPDGVSIRASNRSTTASPQRISAASPRRASPTRPPPS